MPFRYTKEEAFKRWGIIIDPTFDITNLENKQKIAIENYINSFPDFNNRKIGLTLISNLFDFDAMILATNISDKIFNKISNSIKIINVPSIVIESQRYSSSNEALEELNNSITIGDIIILQEISTIKYNEQQKLIISYILNKIINNKKPFIITSNIPIKSMTENLGDLIIKLIYTYSTSIDIKFNKR